MVELRSYKEFFQKLNASHWKCSISEIGLGVPFTSEMLKYAGASNTLLRMECPYNKVFQPDLVKSSISEYTVNQISYDLYKQIVDRPYILSDSDKLFTLSVSGAHKTAEEAGETHVWACIRTGIHSGASRSLHFWMPKTLSREEAIETCKYAVIDFVNETLFGQTINNWRSWIIYVDVKDGVSLKDFIYKNLNQPNPLVYQHGVFLRATDVIRRATKVFRGSFNPPTLAHEAMGQNALFELSTENRRKGRVDLDDLVHRLKMLETLGVPVLITSGCPTFVDLHHLLVTKGAVTDRLQYIVGTDTLNAIVNDNIGLDTLKEVQFLVHERPGHQIVSDNKTLVYETFSLPADLCAISSSHARSTSTGVSVAVLKYMTEKGLYA